MTGTDMRGKVALVTGATRGIGRATAVAFARAGAIVVGLGRSVEDGHETLRLVREAGGEGAFVRADVTDARQLEEAVAETLRRFGRLDYAFNNAGIAGSGAPAGEYTEEEWRRIIDVNLTGVWLAMKYELPPMLAQGSGVIVNNSSALGHVAIPGQAAYVASKHAILGLTKAAALDYAGRGVRVCAICPGFVETAMVGGDTMSPASRAAMLSVEPIGRLGRPEEIANAVVWMCSDEATFMTGSAMVLDGGWLAGHRLRSGA